MKISRIRYALVLGTIFLATATVAGIVTKTRIDAHRKQQTAQNDNGTPPIVSKVRKLSVINAETDPVDSPHRQVHITVRNDSDNGIEAITIKSGSFQLIEDNGLLTDNPKILIEPHSTHSIDIPLQNLDVREKVVIAGVLYADKTEDGLPDALNVMHRERSVEKEKRTRDGSHK